MHDSLVQTQALSVRPPRAWVRGYSAGETYKKRRHANVWLHDSAILNDLNMLHSFSSVSPLLLSSFLHSLSLFPGGRSRSRLQQLVDWCGGQLFSGCLIFDECHKAKNFVPGKEKRSTKIALAVTTIQRYV